MRSLVTGGAGFIGSHLAEALLARGDEVVVLDNLVTGRRENLKAALHHPRLSLLIGDARDPALVRRAANGADVIYHLAAHVGVRRIVGHALESLLNNVQSSMVVLEEAARIRARTILFSSSEVYGRGCDDALREEGDLAVGPPSVLRWTYAAGKAADEALAMAYHADRRLPVTVVRCFNTCGPRQSGRYGMVVPTFLRQALSGEPLTVHGDGEQRRCFSYVGDVVRGVLMLEQEPGAAGEIFNVGNDEEVSILELARRIVALTESTARIIHVPYARIFEEPFEDVRRRVPSLDKIRAFVGYEPRVGLDELLRLTIASLRGRRAGRRAGRVHAPIPPLEDSEG
jgi:UDP-glucose 4-epimerase